jgi:hypothetical protein
LPHSCQHFAEICTGVGSETLEVTATSGVFDAADAGQRQRMLSHGQRWQSMSPEERDKARRGLRRFEHMNPEQREQARALFGQMRDMPPEQRDALLAAASV